MSKFVLTAELQLQAPKNVAQVVRQIQSQLDGVKVDVEMRGAQGAVKSINQITGATNEASSAASKMGKSFQASVRRFTALAIATRAVSLFTSTLSGAVKESIGFERELIKISQVTGSTMKQLGGLSKTITNLSTSLGVSSTNLLSVSRILAQTGLSAKQTEIALGTLARTELAPTFENITQTAEGAVAILNQFGQGARALEAQLGSLNAVAGQFAVEAGDLVAVIRRTGGVFKSAGGDLNELIALFTSVRSTTRESAESIATGLRTIFTRIQRPKTIDYLKEFGVELVDLDGKFVGPFEAAKRLSKALAGLGEGDLKFVEIAEQLGGFRQIGKVLPLLQQFTVAQEALKVAQAGQGSLATDAAKAQAALAIQVTKVKEEFLALVRGITDTGTFQVMADTTLKLASALIQLADTLKPVIPLLTAFAAIKMVKGVGGFLGGLSGGVGKGFNAGGPVRAFARGGPVPGSGNGDTVPAMLTPGEFVIKKSSVKKLGMGNLQAMNENKFSGGKKITSGLSPDALAANAARKQKREALARKQGEESSLKRPDGRPYQFGLASMFGSDLGVKPTILPKSRQVVMTNFGTLDKSMSEKYEGQMRTSVKKIASSMAKSLAGDIKDKTPIAGGQIDELINKAGFANAVGAFFETAIALTGAPYEKGQINDSLDFPSGLKNAAQKFGLPGDIPSDATRTSGPNGKNRNKFAAQVERYLEKMGVLKKMATGGPAGSDTVPALLTPGEFVVNRKSANKIGYGNLNRMNKVGKYAKGGVVQRFASGTGARGAQPSGGGGGGDISGLLSSFDALTAAIQQVVAELEGVNTSTLNMSDQQDEAATATKTNTTQTIKNSKAQKSSTESSLRMMAIFGAITTGLATLAPEIDETSGYLDYLRKNLSEFALQTVTASYLLSSLGAFKVENWKNTMSFIQGSAQEVAQGFSKFRKVLNNPIQSLKTLHAATMAAVKAEAAETLANKAAAASEAQETLANKAATLSEAQETLANKGSTLAGVFAFLSATVIAVGAAFGIAFAPVTAMLIGLGVVIGALTAVFGGLHLLASSELAGARKERAIEEGDVDEAGKQAVIEGGLYSSLLRLNDGLRATARAAAAATKSQKSNEEAQDKANRAMEKFRKGLSTVGELLGSTAIAQRDAVEARVAADAAIAQSARDAQSALDSFWRGLLSWLPWIDSGEQVLAKAEKEQQRLDKDAKQKERAAVNVAMPQLNILQRQVAAAGGSFEDFMISLRSSAAGNDIYKNLKSLDMLPQVREAFENIRDEVERTRKAFEALNLGLRSVQGAALAIKTSVDNLLDGQDGDTGALGPAIATLEASITSAAEAMDPAAIAAAMETAGDALRTLGATDAQIKKFQETMTAIQAAQRGFANATEDARRSLLEDLGNIDTNAGSDNIREAIADAIVNNLDDPTIGPEVKKRLKDAIKGVELDPGVIEDIMAGNLQGIDKILEDLGEGTLKQVITSFNQLNEVLNKKLALETQLVELEQKLISAKQKALDVELEAREWEEKFGGNKVSPQERRANILGKANIRGDEMGLPRLRTGSAQEFRERSAVARQQQRANADTRIAAAGPDGQPGVMDARRTVNSQAFKESEANLKQFFAEDLNTRRKLLEQIEKEITAVEAKTTAEKKAADALLNGTYEQFVEEMAAMGALAAAQTGDPRLMSEFSRTDYGRASNNIDEMRKAGVTSIDGIEIDDVDVSVRSAGLRAGGLNAGQADRFARLGVPNRNPETQDLRDEGLELAASLPDAFQGTIQGIEQQIEVQKKLIKTIEAEIAARSAAGFEVNKKREETNKKTEKDREALEEKRRRKLETTSSMEKEGGGGDNCCDGVSKVEVTNPNDMTDDIVNGLQDVVQGLRLFNFIKRLLDVPRKPPVPDTLRLPEADKPRLPEADKPRLPAPDKPRLIGPETPKDPDFTVRDPDKLRIPGPDRAPTIELPGPTQRRLPGPQQRRLTGPESRTMIDPNAGRKARIIDETLNLPGPQQPRLTGPQQPRLTGPAPEATPVLKGETIPGKQTNIPNKTPQPNKPTSMTPYQPPVIDATNVEVVKAADAAEDASKGFKIFDKLKDGLGGFGTSLLNVGKTTLRVLDVLDPYLMAADYGFGAYKGATAKEGDRKGTQARSADKGLDEQSTLWKMFTGATTGDPRMGGSVTNDYLIGSETGSDLDLFLGGFEAVLRGAMDGGTVTGYNPAGIVGGAVYGGSAEIAKALNFLQQDMGELAKAEEKTTRMREASKDESGLDVNTRNLLGHKGSIQLNLEEAKKSGDSKRVTELEKELSNANIALENRIQERTGQGGDLRRSTGRNQFNGGLTDKAVEEDRILQDQYLEKDKAAQQEERAAQAAVAKRQAELKAVQQKTIQANQEVASQATTGTFDYRTGAQLTTGDTGLGLSRPEEEGARTGFAQRVAKSAINVSKPAPSGIEQEYEQFNSMIDQINEEGYREFNKKSMTLPQTSEAERLPTSYDIDNMTLPETSSAKTEIAAQKVLIDAPLAPGDGADPSGGTGGTDRQVDPGRMALLETKKQRFDPLSKGIPGIPTGTGKYDINTQEEQTNKLIPLEEDKKEMSKIATVDKILEAPKAPSDESAVSSMAGNDQIIKLLAAILQQLKDCCVGGEGGGGSGGGGGGSQNARSIFDFEKTYPATAGGGSIPGNEQLHPRRGGLTIDKKLPNKYDIDQMTLPEKDQLHPEGGGLMIDGGKTLIEDNRGVTYPDRKQNNVLSEQKRVREREATVNRDKNLLNTPESPTTPLNPSEHGDQSLRVLDDLGVSSYPERKQANILSRQKRQRESNVDRETSEAITGPSKHGDKTTHKASQYPERRQANILARQKRQREREANVDRDKNVISSFQFNTPQMTAPTSTDEHEDKTVSVLDDLGVSTYPERKQANILSRQKRQREATVDREASEAITGPDKHGDKTTHKIELYPERRQANILARQKRQGEREAGAEDHSKFNIKTRQRIPNMFLDDPFPTQSDTSQLANNASKSARGHKTLSNKVMRKKDAIKKLPPSFHVDSPFTQSEDIRAQGGPRLLAPGTTNQENAMLNSAENKIMQGVSASAGTPFSAGISDAPAISKGSALPPTAPQTAPSRTSDNGSLGVGSGTPPSNQMMRSVGSVSGYTGGNTSGAMEMGGMVSLLTSMTQILQSIDQKAVKPAAGQNSNARSQDNAGIGGETKDLTQSLSSVFATFNSDFSNIVQRLENVSIQIQIAPVQVNIDLNGGSILQSIRQYVSEELWNGIQKEISQYTMGPNGKLQKSTSTLPSGFGSN